MFNRRYVFALARFYHEPDTWLFGGIYEMTARRVDQYEVRLSEQGEAFIGRLKVSSPYRERTARADFEKHYPLLTVRELLPARYDGRAFPGYDDIDLSLGEWGR